MIWDAWSRIAPKGTLPANEFAALFNVTSVDSYNNGTVSKGQVL